MRPLRRIAEHQRQAFNLLSSSETGKEWHFHSWEHAIRRFVAEARDDDAVHFYRQCAYMARLSNDNSIVSEFEQRFLYLLPELLRERAIREAEADKEEELELDSGKEPKEPHKEAPTGILMRLAACLGVCRA
ncbi:hypothetical protein [Bradyrhizobium sp. UNPF46]|uniref:hypothetical protein n=1 Tax=Bradyrhizobium sp. UNPF46 TaxID=1141168 RepID=UPI00114EEBD1|nr:hypothetical protein [Bradyrhizobium sp. UNPF46]